jgi:Na+-translocating ferredoxin:NAD+ oxidoreductase subunit B
MVFRIRDSFGRVRAGMRGIRLKGDDTMKDRDVYEQLRDKLDDMATGYPISPDGAEMRLLRKLFTTEDAAMFLHLGTSPETPWEVATRIGADLEKAALHLEDMARRGLLFRSRRPGGLAYHAIPFIVGIYEFQVNQLDSEMLRDVSQYYLTGLGQSFHSTRVPHLRTIPINTGMVSALPIAPYDDAVTVVEGKDRIAVATCLCRKAVRMYGKGCSHPLETCLQFDQFADYYVDNGMARFISRDEAVSILENNEKEGLVIQTLNSQAVEAMCACCSCCCGMLISLKLFPAPAREVKSNYVCMGDAGACTGCGTCAGRCPVGAVKVKDGHASLREERCIGCGLCVSTCPEQARSLMKKPAHKLYRPPLTVHEAFMEMSRERGK